MEPLREQQLQEIESLSKELLLACEKGEWESLADIETRRGRLISTFFEASPDEGEVAEIASAIHRIRSTDQQVISLCQLQKQEIAQKLSGMTKGKKVTASYLHY